MARRPLCLICLIPLIALACRRPHVPVPVPVPHPTWHREPTPLPTPIANNAVAATNTTIVSMLGLTSGKTHADITNATTLWQPDHSTPAAAVPGPGRLASAAVTIAPHILLFGGYTVAPDGTEVSVPGIDRYDPTTDTWNPGPSMPIPVDDAVVARWRDRIVLVSGWSNDDNVSEVQWLEPAASTWSTGTPIPGPPVFGHAGGVLHDTVVFCDGVERLHEGPVKYRAVQACFAGDIDPDDPSTITWRPIPPHPGPARYRIGAGTWHARDLLVFAGGTANPYNYDGIGYDGVPAEPVTDVFAWDGEGWLELPPLPEPRMDLRGLVELGDSLYLVGGLDEHREPTATVFRLGP